MKQLSTIIEGILDTNLDLELTMKHVYTIERGNTLLSQPASHLLKGTIDIDLFNSEVKERVKTMIKDFDLKNISDILTRYFMSLPAAELSQKWLDEAMNNFNKRYVRKRSVWLSARLDDDNTVVIIVSNKNNGYELGDYYFAK